MEHEFDIWNELKKEVDAGPSIGYFPKEGEVWMSVLGKNIGYEQNGAGQDFSRPILIIKRFNNQMFWCVPLSTKQKNLDFYLNFTDPNGRKVSLILAQMRLMSIKRLKRKLFSMRANDMETVRTKLFSFLL